jgi:molybdopterin molybdotransferase
MSVGKISRMELQPLTAADVDQVWAILAEHVRPAKPISVTVQESLGRVLASDARAAFDFPPFDRAVMDGYAVRCIDVSGDETILENVGLARAGHDIPTDIANGQCLRINTGAAMPASGNAVVMVEKSEPVADGHVRLKDTPRPGQHCEKRGGILAKGDLIVRGGIRIGAGTLAAMIAGGAEELSVFPPPRVGVLSTGDEIIAGGDSRAAGQIYDSNSVMLSGLVEAAHARPVRLGRCPDDRDALRALIQEGLACDVLCITGGMSKGSHDLVPELAEELGVEWLVTSLNMKPGKPMHIGRAPSGCWLVGLPGNPVSCAVCFLLFGRTILDGLQGLGAQPPAHMRATLAADMPINGKRPLFQPGEWHVARDGTPVVNPTPWRGSGDPFGLATANALVYRPAQAPGSPAGDTVRIIPLDVPR